MDYLFVFQPMPRAPRTVEIDRYLISLKFRFDKLSWSWPLVAMWALFRGRKGTGVHRDDPRQKLVIDRRKPVNITKWAVGRIEEWNKYPRNDIQATWRTAITQSNETKNWNKDALKSLSVHPPHKRNSKRVNNKGQSDSWATWFLRLKLR